MRTPSPLRGWRILIFSMALAVFWTTASTAFGQEPPQQPQNRRPSHPWTPMLGSAGGAPSGAQAPSQPNVPLSSSSWTPIGPASLATTSPANANSLVSGRITGIAAHPTDPNTIYVTPAGGGVWKTTN